MLFKCSAKNWFCLIRTNRIFANATNFRKRTKRLISTDVKKFEIKMFLMAFCKMYIFEQKQNAKTNFYLVAQEKQRTFLFSNLCVISA